jgi:hypothetical protein
MFGANNKKQSSMISLLIFIWIIKAFLVKGFSRIFIEGDENATQNLANTNIASNVCRKPFWLTREKKNIGKKMTLKFEKIRK